MLTLFLYLFAALNGGGPVVETCDFLPADDPCHFVEPPPPVCEGPNGPNVCEGP